MSDNLVQEAEKAVSDFLKADPADDLYGQIFQKANLGMRLIHERNTNARIEIDQKIRVIGMVFTDPKVKEQYTRATMPKLLPELKAGK